MAISSIPAVKALSVDNLQAVVQQHAPKVFAPHKGLGCQTFQTVRRAEVGVCQARAFAKGAGADGPDTRGQSQPSNLGTAEAVFFQCFKPFVEPDGN